MIAPLALSLLLGSAHAGTIPVWDKDTFPQGGSVKGREG